MEQNVKHQRKFVKTEKLFFRASPELKRQMIARSEDLGKSVSEYIRDLVKADLKKG